MVISLIIIAILLHQSSGERVQPQVAQSNYHHEPSNLLFINADQECFKAAVFQYARIDSENAQLCIKENLHAFREAAKKASENGVKIVVFPEGGLISPRHNYTEEIPDPELLQLGGKNLCDSSIFDGKELRILKELSCIARDHKIYLVANFGSKVLCEPGNFIKRYWKYNLFLEAYDEPPRLELVHFDTPMGRMGTFVCFDMIFKQPAVDLVEKHQVDTIIFPTLWFDELPLLTAIQYQDAWSYRMNVNLLAANVLNRPSGTVGSGIYSGEDFLYSASDATRNALLIASIPKHPSRFNTCMRGDERLALESGPNYTAKEYDSKHFELLPSDSVYIIDELEAKKIVCSGRICCQIDYKMSDSSQLVRNSLVFIVRDSLRPGPYPCYEQVCTLATLEAPISNRPLKAIRFSREALVSFKRLSIEGLFNTKYVYPIAAHSVQKLIPRSHREYECKNLAARTRSRQGKIWYLCKSTMNCSLKNGRIYSFGLYGRLYERDRVHSN